MPSNELINDLNSLFLDLEEDAENIRLYASGFAGSYVTVPAVVDYSAEYGTNEMRGDGRARMNADRGRSVRRSATVELDVKHVVPEDGKAGVTMKDPTNGSWVQFMVKRILGRDAGMQQVLVVRTEGHVTQPLRRDG